MPQDYNNIHFPGWEVVRKLGEGSFGGVYEIMRTLPDGTVERSALKKLIVPKEHSEIDELRSLQYDNDSITAHFRDQMQDLVKEYSLMQKLGNNPYVVHCQDLQTIQHGDGIGWDIYIRMELLTPLKQAISREYKEIEVIRLAANMCSALNGCHQSNIIHRDIKPENILVSSDGKYKLGDFGIAKITEKTATGTLTGTYSYMAPEIFNHQHYGASADIYSLGLVMYWMMNEYTLPFLPRYPRIPTVTQKQQAQERRFLGEKIPEPVNGSMRLKRIVLKACAFSPQNRYTSVLDLAYDLQNIKAEHRQSDNTLPGETSDNTLLFKNRNTEVTDNSKKFFHKDFSAKTLHDEKNQSVIEAYVRIRKQAETLKEKWIAWYFTNNRRILFTLPLAVAVILLLGIFGYSKMMNQDVFAVAAKNPPIIPTVTTVQPEDSPKIYNYIPSTTQEIDQIFSEIAEEDIRNVFTFVNKTADGQGLIVDYSGVKSEDVNLGAYLLSKIPNVNEVCVMDYEKKSNLTVVDVKKIMTAAPKAKVRYSFDLFGKKVSTTDEEIEIEYRVHTSDDEQYLRDALDILTDCKKFVLEMDRYVRLSNETMAEIRDEYRDRTKIIWRVWFADQGSCLTDRKTIRYTYNLNDSNCKELAFCEDVEYLDLGHNEDLSDISWVSNMKNLKAIIISGSAINSFEPFLECKNLEFLEATYCGYIKDIYPLSGLKKLKMLNISYTKVWDLSPLDYSDLEVVMAVKTDITQTEINRINALTKSKAESEFKTRYCFSGNENGIHWRYEADNETKTKYYQQLCEVFGYPNAVNTTW